ncbi:tetratricopeptide repeat protein [Spirosoma validum]|uniref:Tetratricopeptide repeat protein n=1 Tax=Spirosoma validum TaxID=2771355 RepID=A0A927AY59_9BACT|nr:tetratricopeptide repeat protein [Spirosoma validum]MBD2751842.1 tetratricopeptide repeat protein [Spirosoma validum]
MVYRIRYWLMSLLIGVSGWLSGLYAQELTTRDNEEVKLLARRKVELGLNDLLNVLSLSDLGEFERNALISDSYVPGVNQLFASKETIVEDDVSPDRTATATVLDMPVEKYLANFDLLYAKSSQSTIAFSDFTVSNLKQSNTLYVKVFYTALFGGKHTKIDKPYQPVRRVAEMQAIRVGAKWTVLITRLAFATHDDSTNLTRNDVALKEVALRTVAVRTDSTIARDSTQMAVAAPVDPEREREKAILDTYQKLLKEGETAFAAGDMVTAQRVFEQAEKQKPFEDLTPKVRLFTIQKTLDERSRNSVVELKKRLNLALRKRRYTEALSLMQAILKQQPDSTALETQSQDVMAQARRKAELDERFASGQYKELVKEYGRIIDAERKQNKQPSTSSKVNSSDWFLGRGKSYTQLGDYKEALRDLNESLTLDFQNLDALESRADLYARMGDFPKAAADLSVYLTIDPANAELLTRRAAYRIRTNRPTEASADYDEAIRINDKNPRYYLLRGQFHLQNGSCDKAEADFTEGINRSRRQPELYFQRGVAYVCLKQFNSAGDDFARATELGVDARIRAQIDSVAAKFYQQSQQDIQARKVGDALAQLDIALRLKPDYAAAWLVKGELLLSTRADKQAAEALTNAIRYKPTDALTYYQRGLANMRLNAYADATVDFQKAISFQADMYDAALGEAKARTALRQYDKAQATLTSLRNIRKQLEKRYPPAFFADVYFLSGRCAYELKQYSDALERFEDALSITKDWAAAYTERGRTYEALEKPDRARDDYNRAAQLEPTVASHYVPLALMLERREKFEEALTDYARCQELDQEHELANVVALGRGRCLMALGKYLDALAELNRYGQYDGVACTDECLYLRTYAQVRTGQLPENVRMVGLSTTSASPENAPKLRYVLACAHLQANDEKQALTQLEKALQMGLPREFLKKDKLLDFVRKDFRKNQAYTQLANRYK